MAAYSKQKRGKTRSSSTDSRRFNKNRQIKFKPHKAKPIEDKTKVLNEKIDKAQESMKSSVEFDPLSNINEQYSHDLVMYTMFLQMIANMTNEMKQSETERVQEVFKNQQLSDKNIQHNLKTYEEFRTNFKFLKIVEAKLEDKNLKPDDIARLEKERDKSSQQLDAIAQKFEFKSADPTRNLTFKNADEFLEFNKLNEKINLSNAYRMAIIDPAEKALIDKTPINKLYDLAIETKDKENTFDETALDKSIDNNVEKVADMVKEAASLSPVGLALKG